MYFVDHFCEKQGLWFLVAYWKIFGLVMSDELECCVHLLILQR
jgi:hypothetical protein